MNLSQQDIALFYKLWYGMVWGINEKHKIIPHFKRPTYGTKVTVSREEFMKIRNAIWDNPKFIDEFLNSHESTELSEEERGIIASWRKHFVRGTFLVVKHLAKYSVLMSFNGKPAILYGVQGITDPIKDAFPYQIPFQSELVLLPYKDKIIYDTFIAVYRITFGAGMRSAIKEWYAESKETYGVLEALNRTSRVLKLPIKKPKKKSKIEYIEQTSNFEPLPEGVKVPKPLSKIYNEIAKIISEFANEKLNEEYKALSLKALEKLCRKRPSPLVKGKPLTWACGIVYAIGSSNFIFDKSQPIHMTGYEIADWFGLSKSTAGNKASEVSKALNISYMNSEFLLKSLIDNNPAIWHLLINGLYMDIRRMPREIQEKAYRKGLIPYIPADKG